MQPRLAAAGAAADTAQRGYEYRRVKSSWDSCLDSLEHFWQDLITWYRRTTHKMILAVRAVADMKFCTK